jgi:hypothetical protein
MAGDLLLDTGALVTLLDRSQANHGLFVRFFESWKGSILSTEAVLTEATHLLGRAPDGPRTCLQFFLAGGAILVPSSPSTLRRAYELMGKYADLPMDFADSTLVVLAEEIQTDLILTTDRRDFDIYRIRERGRFRILPG